jgi:hypothetical protein
MSDQSTFVTVPATGAPADLVGASIVLVGAFDPMMVQPAHLLGNGLLAESDFAQLRYDVLASEVSVAKAGINHLDKPKRPYGPRQISGDSRPHSNDLERSYRKQLRKI